MLDQHFHQLERFVIQTDTFAAAADRHSGLVKLDIRETDDVGLEFLLAPQHRADARQQLGGGKRFWKVVVRTRVKSQHPVLDRVAGGEHQRGSGNSL